MAFTVQQDLNSVTDCTTLESNTNKDRAWNQDRKRAERIIVLIFYMISQLKPIFYDFLQYLS